MDKTTWDFWWGLISTSMSVLTAIELWDSLFRQRAKRALSDETQRLPLQHALYGLRWFLAIYMAYVSVNIPLRFLFGSSVSITITSSSASLKWLFQDVLQSLLAVQVVYSLIAQRREFVSPRKVTTFGERSLYSLRWVLSFWWLLMLLVLVSLIWPGKL